MNRNNFMKNRNANKKIEKQFNNDINEGKDSSKMLEAL